MPGSCFDTVRRQGCPEREIYVLLVLSRGTDRVEPNSAVDAFLHRFDLRVYHLHACDPLIREETGTPPAAVEWS
jgi:hypothetical protein